MKNKLTLWFILAVVHMAPIVTPVSFSYAANEPAPVEIISDFERVTTALAGDDIQTTQRLLFKKKAAAVICPQGNAEGMVYNTVNIPFTQRKTELVGAKFKFQASKTPTTFFFACNDGDNLNWYRYVGFAGYPKEKGSKSIHKMQESASKREPVVYKDARMYAKVSVSDTNLIFCQDKKAIKFLGLTQRDKSLFELENIDTDVIALQFMAKRANATSDWVYPAVFSHLKFDVQCGDETVRELWIAPRRIPGRMLELRGN